MGDCDQDACSYAKSSRSRCFLDHNSEGKLVKKCEKSERLLRQCIGKPREILESTTQYTEEDAPHGWTLEASLDKQKELHPFPFDMPSLPHGSSQTPSLPDMQPFSKGLEDGFEIFIHAAEETMNSVFNQLGIYSHDEERETKSHGSGKRIPSEGYGRKWGGSGSSHVPSSPPQNRVPSKTPDFTSFSKDFEEV